MSSSRTYLETYVDLEIDSSFQTHLNIQFSSQVNCDAPKFNIELTHAEKILPGDCLYTLNAKKGENHFIHWSFITVLIDKLKIFELSTFTE